MSEGSGKKIISHGKIYLAGTILQRCVSIIMLPIYTRCLTPADYGVVELLSMTLDFISIILGMRIGQALFRFYHEYTNPKDQGEVISTAIYLVGGLNVCGVLVVWLFSQPLSNLIFNDSSQVRNLMLFSVSLVGAGFVEIPMTYIRAKQRPWLFVTFSMVKLILQLGLNIIFVVILNMHVKGVIYSAVISSSTMGLALSWFIGNDCGVKFSLRKAKQLISFSFPMMMTSILAFYITFGDRYFLKTYCSLSAVGIYSLAYKFGFMLSGFIVQPFMNIWDTEKYIIYKSRNKIGAYNRIFQGYNVIIFIIVLCMTLFVKDVLRIMADDTFWPAYGLVPLILAAYTINAWAGFVNIGILIHEKTIEITYGAVIAALVITPGYILLIPRFGGAGAAWASFVSFFAAFLWVYFRSKRLYDMRLKWSNVFMFTILVVIANAFASFFTENLLISILIRFLIFIVFSLLIICVVQEYRSLLMVCLKNPRKLFRIKELSGSGEM